MARPRIAEVLGRRLVEMERRLSDSVLKRILQRVANTLITSRRGGHAGSTTEGEPAAVR